MKGIIFTVISFFVAFASTEVPSYIHVCGRRNPNLDQCVLNSVSNMQDKLRSGIKEFDVPPIDPLVIDKVSLVDFDNFKASATNVTMHGLSHYDVKSLKVDLNKTSIEIEISFKVIRLTANYDVNAKILVPISGKGPIDVISYDVQSHAVLKYKLVTRKGQTYMFFTTMKTKLSIKDYTANFKPSDGPESPLATAINTALATSRQELLEGTIPNLEKTISERVIFIANKICKHFTYEELFPDRE